MHMFDGQPLRACHSLTVAFSPFGLSSLALSCGSSKSMAQDPVGGAPNMTEKCLVAVIE